MRIAMVAYACYDGNSRIQQYARALSMCGDTVDIFCLERQADTIKAEPGIHIHKIQNRNLFEESRFDYVRHVLRFLLRSSSALARMHRKNPYDVIHVHSVPDFLVFAALVPKLLGTPIILDIHDILPEFYAAKYGKSNGSVIFKLLVWVERVSIAFADHVIVANPIWRDRLIGRSAKPEKVTAIGNHPNPEIFFWRPKERHDGKFVVTYPGSLNWHQGLEIAVRAFARVAPEAPEAEFHIYGEGPARAELEHLAQEIGMEQRVKFKDSVSTQEVVRVMAESDLGVVPKRSKSVFGTEAASTKIMEFMAVGVPLVVSRTKIDTLYHTEATVKFYDDDDPKELAKAILHLYRNPELRKELAANGLVYAQEQSWSRRKADYLTIVDGLVGHRPIEPSSLGPSQHSETAMAGSDCISPQCRPFEHPWAIPSACSMDCPQESMSGIPQGEP